MIYNDVNLFKLGKGFELGLISYDSLSDGQKCDLSRYFAMKNDMLDNGIKTTQDELSAINSKLDYAYQNLQNLKK